MPVVPYDSREDTLEHIHQVQDLLRLIILDLDSRMTKHDQSKLEDPEKETFDRVTPLLKDLEYGSPEYKACLEDMGPALAHHYEHNRHHPEHFVDGVLGMNLVDLIEMLCDWLAATRRHANGDIQASIEQNQGRFGYTHELKQIFLNTLDVIGAK